LSSQFTNVPPLATSSASTSFKGDVSLDTPIGTVSSFPNELTLSSLTTSEITELSYTSKAPLNLGTSEVSSGANQSSAVKSSTSSLSGASNDYATQLTAGSYIIIGVCSLVVVVTLSLLGLYIKRYESRKRSSRSEWLSYSHEMLNSSAFSSKQDLDGSKEDIRMQPESSHPSYGPPSRIDSLKPLQVKEEASEILLTIPKRPESTIVKLRQSVNPTTASNSQLFI
jgi:hypothetical protein